MKHLEDLLFWITEREKIRKLKESGAPRPWTQDPILDKYRFCNVFREDDVVTKWIHENWLNPHRDESSVYFAMVLARMVNYPDTLKEIGYPHAWNGDTQNRFIRVFGERRERRLKSWTSAYMITGGYSVGGEKKEFIINRVLDGAWANLNNSATSIVRGASLGVAHSKIMCPGIGTFLSGQVVADLKFGPLRYAKDWYTWCTPGPGSTAGLNYLRERPPTKTLTIADFRAEVNEVQAIILDKLDMNIDAQNVQNCLCEFSKYVRTKYYGGSPKALYTPA